MTEMTVVVILIFGAYVMLYHELRLGLMITFCAPGLLIIALFADATFAWASGIIALALLLAGVAVCFQNHHAVTRR
jgi:hypothetical protein